MEFFAIILMQFAILRMVLSSTVKISAASKRFCSYMRKHNIQLIAKLIVTLCVNQIVALCVDRLLMISHFLVINLTGCADFLSRAHLLFLVRLFSCEIARIIRRI